MILAALLPLLAASAEPVAAARPATLEEDRLAVCLEQARTDPASAVATASEWLSEVETTGGDYPRQCLGIAYTRLSRWQAAEEALLAARDAAVPAALERRARLGTMAGSAALAGGRHEAALAIFDQALLDAQSAQSVSLAGMISIDRARALVALGRNETAQDVLASARRDAPQEAEGWLLSATLARRLDKLDEAQGFIETAAGLAPEDPAIGLEAGVIAVLGGRDEAARTSWQSVLQTAPDSAEATAAKSYLAQLAGG